MKLEKFILKVLANAEDRRMCSPEAILVMLPAGIVASLGDVEAALRSLEEKRQAFGTATDDGMLWKITPNGKARLA